MSYEARILIWEKLTPKKGQIGNCKLSLRDTYGFLVVDLEYLGFVVVEEFDEVLWMQSVIEY